MILHRGSVGKKAGTFKSWSEPARSQKRVARGERLFAVAYSRTSRASQSGSRATAMRTLSALEPSSSSLRPLSNQQAK